MHCEAVNALWRIHKMMQRQREEDDVLMIADLLSEITVNQADT